MHQTNPSPPSIRQRSPQDRASSPLSTPTAQSCAHGLHECSGCAWPTPNHSPSVRSSAHRHLDTASDPLLFGVGLGVKIDHKHLDTASDPLQQEKPSVRPSARRRLATLVWIFVGCAWLVWAWVGCDRALCGKDRPCGVDESCVVDRCVPCVGPCSESQTETGRESITDLEPPKESTSSLEKPNEEQPPQNESPLPKEPLAEAGPIESIPDPKAPESSEYQEEPRPEPTPEPTPEGPCVEGVQRSCYDGPQSTREIGRCRDGKQTCQADGRWGPCVGSILPTTETCDGTDEDCDGHIDGGKSLLGCVSTIAGNGQRGFAEGFGRSAQFNYPTELAIAPDGTIYVADTVNHRIRKIDRRGEVSTYAGDGTDGYKDGPAAQAQFSRPSGLALAPDGTLYVADTVNHAIRRIRTDGRVETFSGSGAPGFVDGPGPSARFYFPASIVFDRAGNLYLADTVNHAIRKLDPQGHVSLVAGTRQEGFANGPPNVARFDTPVGIAIDATNQYLFVGDNDNHQIRRIRLLDGYVTTYAGTGQRGFAEGDALNARFYAPLGLVSEPNGAVFVADSINYRIRMINPLGQVISVAGGIRGNRDGFGNLAQFSGPASVQRGPRGDLYVADFSNHTIRKITIHP